jgi:hypothetical protein
LADFWDVLKHFAKRDEARKSALGPQSRLAENPASASERNPDIAK